MTPHVWGGNACCTLLTWENVASGAADSDLLNTHQEADVRIMFHLGAAAGHVINIHLIPKLPPFRYSFVFFEIRL